HRAAAAGPRRLADEGHRGMGPAAVGPLRGDPPHRGARAGADGGRLIPQPTSPRPPATGSRGGGSEEPPGWPRSCVERGDGPPSPTLSVTHAAPGSDGIPAAGARPVTAKSRV